MSTIQFLMDRCSYKNSTVSATSWQLLAGWVQGVKKWFGSQLNFLFNRGDDQIKSRSSTGQSSCAMQQIRTAGVCIYIADLFWFSNHVLKSKAAAGRKVASLTLSPSLWALQVQLPPRLPKAPMLQQPPCLCNITPINYLYKKSFVAFQYVRITSESSPHWIREMLISP